jgi:nascent polypeptide-associated complex subunit alpha
MRRVPSGPTIAMFPGMGGRVDPRQMNQMMKRLGIDIQEVPDVTEVVIRTPTREFVFTKPEVTIMTAQGQRTFQVVGEPQLRTREAKVEISEADVQLVSEQTGKTMQEARTALEATKGDIAEAIVRLQT